ncbi:MAG: hypothetical protein C4527_21415, partial [Candidatus Omnitrophota bacterium]
MMVKGFSRLPVKINRPKVDDASEDACSTILCSLTLHTPQRFFRPFRAGESISITIPGALPAGFPLIPRWGKFYWKNSQRTRRCPLAFLLYPVGVNSIEKQPTYTALP